MVSLYSLILFLPVLAFMAVGVYALFQQAAPKTRALFFTLCFLVSVWLSIEAFVYSAETGPAALMRGRFLYFVTSIMLAVLVHFSLTFLGRTAKYFPIILGSYVVGGFFGLGSLLNSYFFSGTRLYYWGYFPQYGPLGYGYSLFAVGCVGIAMAAFIREWQWAHNTKREESVIKWMLAAYAAASLCSVNHLPAYGYEVYPAGYIAAFGFVIISAYAINQYGLQTIVPQNAARTILTSIDEPIAACNEQGRITFVNEVFEGLVGESDPEGHLLDELVPFDPDDVHAGEAIECEFGERCLKVTAHSLCSAPGTMYILYDVTEQVRLRAELEESATHDELTGLPNRRGLLKRFESIESEVTILFVDIDKLKAVNETLGHEYGDMLIKESARRLSNLDGVNYAARIGGDEFVLIAEPGRGDDIIDGVFEQFEERPFELKGNTIYSSASIGLHSGYPEDENFLNRASRAMKKAKDEPGTAYARSSQNTPSADLRVGARLRDGVQDGEIVTFFQPIVNLESEATVRLEALVRWDHPERGLLAPEAFLKEAEEYGVIADIDFKVIDQAAAAIDRHDLSVPVHVNLSSHQFIQNEPDELFRHFDTPHADQFVVEVTEAELSTHQSNAREILSTLKQIGADIALDDFGTDHSSMAYLKSWPTDILKIDRTLVDPLPGEGSRFVRSLADFAQSLDQQVIAEGVEREGQKDCLVDADIQYAQGFYFARPVPPENLAVAE